MLCAVYVGLEIDSVLRYLSQVSKAEHLESAAVGKDRAVPGHELVKTAKLADYLVSRP